MARDSDYGAFMEKFPLQPSPSLHQLPLHGLTFAFKDMWVLSLFFKKKNPHGIGGCVKLTRISLLLWTYASNQLMGFNHAKVIHQISCWIHENSLVLKYLTCFYVPLNSFINLTIGFNPCSLIFKRVCLSLPKFLY